MEKKKEASKLAFKHQPKPFKLQTSVVAKDFVNLQITNGSDFRIADVIAQQSGIKEIEQKNIEAKVEDTVLERLKEIQEQAYSQAYELGKIEGTEKAFKDKSEDLGARLQHFDELLKTIDNMTKNIGKEAESTIVKAIFHIAEKIAMRSLQMDQSPIVELLNNLVDEVQGAESTTIKLSPADMQFVEELRTKGVKEVENLQRVKLQAVEEITKGGCIIETNFGAIDATVEQRVSKAWAIIEGKLPVAKAAVKP